MTTNEISRDRSEIFWLPHHLVLSHLDVVLENVIHLILLEEFQVLLLGLGDPGKRLMVCDVDLLQGFRLFHLRL